MSSKIDKTIARQQEKIAEGAYYEAHQQLRVIAARYTRSAQYPSAIAILFQGALALLKAGQGGSGGDLCMLLLDVYNKAEIKVDAESKGRLLTLLRSFPAAEPTKKRFMGEVVGWSARNGEYPAGEPEVCHVCGTIFAADEDLLEAERLFILGTRDSPTALAALEYAIYTHDEPSTAALYAARAVLPYLLTGNIWAAKKSYLHFTTKLQQSSTALNVQEISSKSSELRVYPSLPLLNFLGLLLLSVERGAPELFRLLKRQFAEQLKEVEIWNEALEQVGEMYFGIAIPKQMNPMGDLMNMFLGGGGGGGGSQQKAKRVGPPPAALD